MQSGKKTTVNTEFKTKKPPLDDTDETPVHFPATKQATTKPRLTVVPTPRAAVQYLNRIFPQTFLFPGHLPIVLDFLHAISYQSYLQVLPIEHPSLNFILCHFLSLVSSFGLGHLMVLPY